jgi:signal transduction histidine kinase
MLLAVVLGGVLATSVVAPLEKLSRSALRIQRGRLDRPVDLVGGGRDEVASLARAMERMREGILERDDRLRLMLAQVAHELRNPLGGLELFASAAASTDDADERSRLIGRVRDEVAALNRIITDFLTFARPLEPQYEPVDLRSAVEEAAELSRAELAPGGSLEVRLPELPLIGRADRDQVKRAVLNLLRNAAQAGTNVRVWVEREQGDVMIAVLDDGPGISPTIRDRIFDPFVSDKEAGAGLGLAIVRKVAEAHGGRVELRETSDTSFGAGAEFRLYLAGFTEPPVALEPAPVG